MKYLTFAAAFAALIPSLVHAQNPQFSDCRTIEAAGNFVEPDEALVNGLVCKVVKPKPNSAVSTFAPGTATGKPITLPGSIEPAILRSKEKAEAIPTGAVPTPETTPKPQLTDSLAGGVPESPPFEMISGRSLGDIARAYRKDSGTRVITTPEEGVIERQKPRTEVERVAAPPASAPITATSAELQPARKTEVPVAVEAPPAEVKSEIISAAPARVPVTPAEPPQAAKTGAFAVPQAQPVEVKPEAIPAAAAPLSAVPVVKAETNFPGVVPTAASTPEVQATVQKGAFASAQMPQVQAPTEASPAASAAEEAADPESQRIVKLGVFVAPQPPPETNPPPQSVSFGTEENALNEGQLASCTKNVSLGSMEKEKLFLAIPEWAAKWYENNQKKYPGICFSNSPMPGAQNYLVVFYTSAPRVSGEESLTKISASEETTPVTGMGSFTTSYGATWHYTYERTVTTTITSVSAENAPHNLQSAVLYAKAYSEQGIPISQHWPAPATKRSKETSMKPGKNHDKSLPAFRMMAELLSQMVEDIAKL